MSLMNYVIHNIHVSYKTLSPIKRVLLAAAILLGLTVVIFFIRGILPPSKSNVKNSLSFAENVWREQNHLSYSFDFDTLVYKVKVSDGGAKGYAFRCDLIADNEAQELEKWSWGTGSVLPPSASKSNMTFLGNKVSAGERITITGLIFYERGPATLFLWTHSGFLFFNKNASGRLILDPFGDDTKPTSNQGVRM